MDWHWVYTKGHLLLKVCSGESHWRAEEEGDVEKRTSNEDWLERERVTWQPLIGSGVESEKGMGVREWGSKTEWMVRERVSSESGPEWGLGRVRRAEPWMVEVAKST